MFCENFFVLRVQSRSQSNSRLFFFAEMYTIIEFKSLSSYQFMKFHKKVPCDLIYFLLWFVIFI